MEIKKDVQPKSKNLGIILVDFVPYKEKEKIIEWMENIYGADHSDFSLGGFLGHELGTKNISDFKRDLPLFSSGISWNNFVTIWPQGLQRKLLYGEIIRNIPSMFSHVEISLVQITDFAYTIICCGYLKREFYNTEASEKEDLEKKTGTSKT